MNQRESFDRFQHHLMLDSYYGDQRNVNSLVESHVGIVGQCLHIRAQYKGNPWAILFFYWLEMGLQTYEPGSNTVSRWYEWDKDLTRFDPEAQEIDRDILHVFLNKHGLPLPEFWLYDKALSVEAVAQIAFSEDSSTEEKPSPENMLRMHKENPGKWTRKALADRYFRYSQEENSNTVMSRFHRYLKKAGTKTKTT